MASRQLPQGVRRGLSAAGPATAGQRLRFHSDPGSRYGYSGEGFYVLQLLLEESLGLDAAKEMQRRIFDRFGMTNTSMMWRTDFAANLADGYGVDGKMVPHDERSGASAAGSMDTSIADQARFWAAFVRGEGLSAASRAELVGPQVPITSAPSAATLCCQRGGISPLTMTNVGAGYDFS